MFRYSVTPFRRNELTVFGGKPCTEQSLTRLYRYKEPFILGINMSTPHQQKIEAILEVADTPQFNDNERVFLLWLAEALSESTPTTMHLTDIQRLLNLDSQAFSQQLQVVRSLGWLTNREERLVIPEKGLQDIVPKLMSALSSTGRALFVDRHGLCVFNTGLSDTESERFSAIAVNLHLTYRRHNMPFQQTTLSTAGWGAERLDNDSLNIWPVVIQGDTFYFILQGYLTNERNNLILIMWLLCGYYFNRQ